MVNNTLGKHKYSFIVFKTFDSLKPQKLEINIENFVNFAKFWIYKEVEEEFWPTKTDSGFV